MLKLFMSAVEGVALARQYFVTGKKGYGNSNSLQPQLSWWRGLLRGRGAEILQPLVATARDPKALRANALKCTGKVNAVAQPTGFGVASDEAGVTDVRAVTPVLPNLMGKRVRAYYNPVSLAYLGDSVWELYARRRHFYPPLRLKQYYDDVVTDVRAESQEAFLEIINSGDFLTDEEQEIVKWGKNAKVTVPPRFHGSGKHKATYKNATALEVLVGYLYVTDPPRLHKMMHHLGLCPKDVRLN